MAKNTEDRYQSALGLKFDLVKCLESLQATGKQTWFELGQQDISDRFIIPDKFYGRETEISTLLQAFERVSLGATEMMLVAGFSGIGKTAVVNEIHKLIVRQRGYFIKGKYDQFQLNQVFMNLIANAIDALDEFNQGRSFKEIKANLNRIKITTSVENNLVKIAILDNDKGMNEEVRQKIFDHLFTTKAVGKGTGLGLAIARQIIVEKHGGTIAVNSTLGEGTEFVIALPILMPR